MLSENPKCPSLQSHPYVNEKFGKVWSCWATGDVRIVFEYIFEYTDQNLVLLLLDIGGHSGKNSVY